LSITSRILEELKESPATAAELLTLFPGSSIRGICGTISNLRKQGRIVAIGKVIRDGDNGGQVLVYALPGTPMMPSSEMGKKTAPAPSCDGIAGGEYATATRRTYANIIFPGAGSRRGL
jgi:hypothetical protein